jgi:hypothetical protein
MMTWTADDHPDDCKSWMSYVCVAFFERTEQPRYRGPKPINGYEDEHKSLKRTGQPGCVRLPPKGRWPRRRAQRTMCFFARGEEEEGRGRASARCWCHIVLIVLAMVAVVNVLCCHKPMRPPHLPSTSSPQPAPPHFPFLLAEIPSTDLLLHHIVKSYRSINVLVEQPSLFFVHANVACDAHCC